ncbi:hypothetical protein L202_01575 [Cryptococcus amylolentus CBS 6039]|uniref:Glycerophosphocholine acyltransferase 1 n=2 Tax=Cryptococcus amylolentus TaxID=104669 RepID=A0A1E3I476_9TREE|nr:hypothetical protein L202_01575 [Cryptococcus amylolentus CBS 6039]ODN83434.1 hypothetical protein L202_01575 [Cryptococcus amylolentus CBS 6039]ODO10960.1 hypothetical protein I350_01559 [Cryptococcus amylolentus CBS 6273]
MSEQSSVDTRPSAISRNNSSLSNLMTMTSLDRYQDDWAGAFTLLDVIETFFDSRLDLFNRRLKAQSSRLKNRAVELLPKGLRTPKGGGILLLDEEEEEDSDEKAERVNPADKYRRDVEREVDRIKVKLAAKVTHLSATWRSDQVIRTRDKVCFLFGVLSLTFTAFIYGRCPEWLPVAYTVQAAFYLPLRIYTYKKKAFHYFLFGDLCYFVNVLDLLWIWIFPSSTTLFIASYLLTLGPLASAIITWRNSLVFHSIDKVTSIFIHIYPPIVLTVIKHMYPGREERFPGLQGVDDWSWYGMILVAGGPYIIWQATYYKFISIDRKTKIESGQRETSFHYMLNDKRGPIGKALKGVPAAHRELWFIFGQLIYSIIFMIPPAALLIHSANASYIFIVLIFAASTWNGASFYVEVFGRKFERELEKLRKEMEEASRTLTPGPGSTPAEQISPASTYATISPSPTPPREKEKRKIKKDDELANSPLVLPGARKSETAGEMEVPEMVLGKAAEEAVEESEGVRQRRS